MAVVHHFAYGWLTPALAYGVSVLGSLLGLVCTSRARQAYTSPKQFGWLTLSAVSIGGTGIWLMHFLAMLGFTVDGSDVRYAILPTTVSALLAVLVVGIGLVILGTGTLRLYRVLLGGLFAGLGVTVMHYTGMAAIRLDGSVGYDPKLVATSLLIAVVAASAALWFTAVAKSLWMITGAALIMGVAVNGMHYTGMAATRVTLDHSHSASDGIDVTTALPVIAGLAGIVVVILLYSALSIPFDEELRAEALGYPYLPYPESASLWAPRTPVGSVAPVGSMAAPANGGGLSNGGDPDNGTGLGGRHSGNSGGRAPRGSDLGTAFPSRRADGLPPVAVSQHPPFSSNEYDDARNRSSPDPW